MLRVRLLALALLSSVLVPSLAALQFVRALRGIAPLYAASPTESREHPT